MDQPNDAERRTANRRASVMSALAAAALLAVVIIAAVFALDLEVFSAGPHAILAIVLGFAGTILLGVGLMALSFHSSRSDDADPP